MSVSPCVCLSARISKITSPTFTKISVHANRGRGSVSSKDNTNTISYALPVFSFDDTLLSILIVLFNYVVF